MSKFDDIESVSRELSNVSEQRFGPAGFGLIESCLDYTSYIYTIDPELSPAQYRTSRRQLITLGRADEKGGETVLGNNKKSPRSTHVHNPHSFLVRST